MKIKREHKLKIISVLIATTIWYFVVWGKTIEKVVEVPIYYKPNPVDYIVEIEPKTVVVTLSGTRSNFRNLFEKDLSIMLDLSDYFNVKGSKTYQVKVPIETLKLPRGINIKRYEPNYVVVTIEKIVRKIVKVEPQFKNGFDIKKIQVNPSTILVKGPVNVLAKIKSVKTQAIDPEVLKEKGYVKVKLEYLGKNVYFYPNEVEIKLKGGET